MKRRDFLKGIGSLPVAASMQSVRTGTRSGASRQQAKTSPRRTLLLVDDHDILYRSGTKRLLHPLKRHTPTQVIKAREKPWEIAIAWHSEYRDPQTGHYHIWYQSYAGPAAKEKTRSCTVSYATSTDGLHWEKPNLGQYSFNGDRDTNIVLLANGGISDRYGASVLVDPRDPDPARRYKMIYYDFTVIKGLDTPGVCAAFSPDGIHWKKFPGNPLLRTSYGNLGDPVPFHGEPKREWDVPLSMSDALDVCYDPVRHVFAIYGKMWIDSPEGKMYWKHGLGRTESKDFLHWSRPELILTPDELDPSYVEFHTTPVFFYNDCYFGCPQILNRGEGGTIDVELAISRNGMDWQRPFRKPFFLPRSPAPAFDCGSLFTSSTPIFLEDEIRFYYGGYSMGATGADDSYQSSGIGLATMPRDRFAGVRPIETHGQITLKALDLSKCHALQVNADASQGTLTPELLDADGYRIKGFTQNDGLPVSGDSLRHPLRWKEREISSLPKGRYLLRLHLENAEVFAVTLL